MPNARLNAMLSRHCENFLQLFQETTKKLFKERDQDARLAGGHLHEGEYGALRELVCRQFLRPLTPAHLAIGSGFIITADDQTSNQCDVIVYDTNGAPFSSFGELGPFYPSESVVAIGEIKSRLTRSKYELAVQQLNEIESPLSSGQNEDRLSFLIFEEFLRSVDGPINDPATHTSWMAVTRGADRSASSRRLYLSLKDGLLTHAPDELLLPGSPVGHVKAFALAYYEHVSTRRPIAVNLRNYVPEHSDDLRLDWPTDSD